ncbi:dihydrodipicolinate synthase family protein [Cupriavidus basilensis]|uniref:Dihydrodipicolinate synthase family protein n=1 Tax=Cupriavidus basilensis TaxID=68895 RepID=A0A643FUY2_9BURK|nr:dihydrodipicolinate synthase family protein [Cupriavidus basilensis]QOT77474.1 dihydrodipicolinate synthase family protein [Cupriavidus basilensis]
MAADKLRGVFAPVVTPFNDDLSINLPAFVAHCQRLVADGAGVAISGTNSEACSETFEERMALVDAVIDAGIPGERVLVGTGCCAIGDAVALTRHAIDRGCAGVLVLPPFFFKNVQEDGVFAYYRELIERVDDPALRVVLYHIPAMSGVPITLPLIERLVAAFPAQIAGVKDSSGDWDNVVAMLERFPTLSIFPASEILMLRSLALGAAGCISATNNINARDIALAYGSVTEAARLNDSITAVRKAAERFPMVAAVKHTLSLLAGDAGWRHVRPPLVPLAADAALQLSQAMATAMPALRGVALPA